MKKTIILFLLLIPVVYALQQDVIYDIKNTGDITIYTSTDKLPYSKKTFNNITSKQGEIWSINITKGVQEYTTYRIILPQYGIIEYIKANSKVRIDDDNGRITISGNLINKTMDVFLEYIINEKEQKTNYLINAAAILLGISLVSLIVFIVIKLRNKKTKEHNSIETKKNELNRELYTERQLQIIDYIKKHGSVTQAQLEHALNLPKSSLSRNIDTLVQKGVLFKESKGMSNIIGFKNP